MSIDWNKIKFRASSWGNLLTEPVAKADKDAGRLSKSCQTELIRIYNQEVFGRKSDFMIKQMEKGVQVEPESISLLSMLEGRLYYKNDERLENEYFSGHPDIFSGDNVMSSDEIGDIKSSWSLDTFCPKLIEEPDKGYVAQLNCYYDLTRASGGFLAYCLISAPINILESEKRSLLFKMNVISELSPDYLKAANEMERLMVFDDIEPELRCIKIPVPKDEELIERMKNKVPIMRQWLEDFHKKHLSLYENLLT